MRRTPWLFVVVAFAPACDRSEPLKATVSGAQADSAPIAPTATEVRATTRPLPPEATACPTGMLLVEGNYCPDVQLNCKRYMDSPGRYEKFRCSEYQESTCLSKQRRHMKFCIDPHEYVPRGSPLPENFQSFTRAEKTCQGLGKRVCRESEWNFACEGEEMRPYPYGFKRDSGACNADRMDLFGSSGKLRDLRAPPGAYPRCASPFGVLDMAGNLEEFVAMDGRGPARPAMKGAYWQPGRNNCRAAQTAHDRFYNGTETGFRCCADAR